MITVIIVNGRPRAGKDSTVEAMQEILSRAGIDTCAFSSIDPVKELLKHTGLDLSAKTPADRALLSEVGASLEKHSEWRTALCFQAIGKFMLKLNGADGVFFLHVREVDMIERIRQHIQRSAMASAFRVLTILVKSPREENVSSNVSDRDVETMRYDRIIANVGTLDDLEKACKDLLFAEKIIKALA